MGFSWRPVKMRREYKTGTKWCAWRWKDIYWRGELYLRRLIIFQCPLFSIMLHWIKQPDKQRHLHDHPVSMLSIILKGKYIEDYWTADESFYWPFGFPIGQREIRWINWIPSYRAHQIVAVHESGVITLCFAGPREREWGILY